ncbi:MAG: carboxypeptidase regulatory-like domain-containing protein [Pyrinomonadaceae bacterium]
MRQFEHGQGRLYVTLCIAVFSALVITAATSAHNRWHTTARTVGPATDERAAAQHRATATMDAPRNVAQQPLLRLAPLSLPLALNQAFANNQTSATPESIVGPTVTWSQTFSASIDPSVSALAYAPDGQTVATGHRNRTVNIWRATDGTLLHSFPRPAGYSCGGAVAVLNYTPDSQQLFVTDGCSTRLTNAADGTLVRQLSAVGQTAVSPDGQYLAASSGTSYRARIIQLFRVSDGTLLWSAVGGGGQVAFAPDGTLATVNRDGIEFWRLTDGVRTRLIPGPKGAIAFSPDSSLVAAAGAAGGEYPYDSTVEWYTVADGALVRQVTRTGSVGMLRFTPDGQYLLAGGFEADFNNANSYGTSTNAIRIFRLSDGLTFKTYDLGTESPGVGGLSLAPDGQHFAYGVAATTYLAQFPPQTACTYSVTPTNSYFERAGGEGTVVVNTQPGCAWTARARVDWLSTNASGTGPGPATFNVAPYTNAVAPGPPYYHHDVVIVADQTVAVHQNVAPSCPCYYDITGYVQDASCLDAISGATVTLTGGATATTQTDANGQFSFPNVPGGQAYTVTVTKDGYAFAPQNWTTSNLSANANAYFQTTVNPNPNPFLRGHIKDASGAGLYGIELHLDGGAYPRTDYSYDHGVYAFNCLEPGHNYTLTPTSETYAFSPPSRTFNNLTAGQQNLDFVALPKTVTISGHVTLDGQPLSDVLMRLFNDGNPTSTTTDATGFYTFSVSAPGYHDLVPSKPDYRFTPQVVNLIDPASNQTLDFAARHATTAIEGYVRTSDDHTLSGATVQLSGTTSATKQTDTSGHFLFDNLAAFGDYTVTITKPSWTFSPASKRFDFFEGTVGGIYYGTQDVTDGLCVDALTPASADLPAGGGNLSTQISAPAGCTWTAHADADWIVITRGYTNGTGNHLFAAQVFINNASTPRTGHVTIGGRTLTVTQRGLAEPDIAWLSGGQAGGSGNADLSPDHQLLATASDGTVKLWRFADGQLLHTIGAAFTGVNAVKFSPDGQYLAVGTQWLPGASDYVGTLKLYRVSDRALVRQFNVGSIFDVRGIAWSPDGQLLYAAMANASVEVWHVADGAFVRRLGPFSVRALALSPDGQFVAAAGNEYWSDMPAVRVWRTSDGAIVQTFSPLNLISNSVTFSPDGQTLAAGDWGGIYSAGGAVYLWRTSDWSLLRKLQEPQDASVSTLAFSPDSQLIASAGTDAFCSVCPNNVYVWHVADGALVNTFPAHPGTVFHMNFVDNTTLLTRGGEQLARLFHIPDGTLLRTIGAARIFVTSVAFSADNQYFAANGAYDGQASLFGAELFRAADGTRLHTLLGHEDIVNTVAFAPNGQMLATASGSEPPDTRDTRIILWQPTTGANLRALAGHAGGTLSVTFAPDSQVLASGGRDNKIKIWNASDGTLLKTLSGHINYVHQVAFAPDGALLASASGDASIKLWRTSDWTLVRTLSGNGFPVSSVSFSPDGQQLAVGFNSYGNNIQLYRVADGALLRTIAGDTSSFMGQVTFAHDGQTLLSTSRSYPPAIWFWSVADGQLERVYEQETGWRYAPAIAVSPDGTMLGIGRYDQTVEIARYPNTGSTCAIGMTPQSQNVTAAGGAFNVNITAAPACAWTAVSNDPAWLSITTGASSTGNGQVTYAVVANTTTAQRTGSLNIAGQTFTVTQAPAPVFSITGHVTDALGNGLAGVTVTLGGAGQDGRTTDANGDYSFTNLAGGASYTLNAALVGYTFTPATQTVNNMSGDMIEDFAVAPNAPGQVLISEFRTRGPAGAADEFVELANNTDQPITVATTDGSAGWTLATLDPNSNAPALVCTISAGTVIPARGHYLMGNENGAAAAGALWPASAFDQTYAPDLADDEGLALFRTSAPTHMTLAYRLDAVGFNNQSSTSAPLFTEGVGLAPVNANVAADEQFSYVRKLTSGMPQDTGDNTQDFVLVSTTGTVAGTLTQLGAPGPENLSSPVQRNATIKGALIERLLPSTAPPNRVRDFNVVPNGALGTLTLRRKFTNKTGQPVTALRFRIVDITTLHTPNAGGAQADLRALDSADVVVTLSGGVQVTVKGTTLEQPPTQGQGGGLNSTLTVQLPGGALAAGATVNVQFTLGVQASGNFRFLVNVEALTAAPASTQKVRSK